MKIRLGLAAVALLVIGVVALAAAILIRSDDSEAKPVRPMVSAGEQAPSFNLEGADGKYVSLEQYRGKNVLLYFSMGYG